MIGRTDPAELADSVLERVAGLAPDAAAEVSVLAREAGLTRFAGSYIHQNVAERELRVTLRVIRDGRWTTASTDRAGADGLDQLVKSTVDAVRLAPVDPDFPGLAAAAPVAFAGNWDAATATATPAERAAVVADFVAATGSLPAAGYVQTGCRQGAFANTAGQRAAGATTHADVDGIARTSTSDGAGRWAGVALADLSGADTGRAAAEAAAAGAEPTDLPPGDYEVVLGPACVDDVLGFLTNYGFNGRTATEGRSFVALGEQQFDPAIRFWEDPTDTRSPSLPYDAEGTPRQRVDLIVDGVSSALLHDRRTAAAAGTTSTGHAGAESASWGPTGTDLRLGTGDGGTARQLAARMDRGLLIADFWYTRVLDPRTVVVTGLTRNGVWLVEGGEITRPVRNLRFTQSYVDALRPGAVLGIGTELGALAGSWSTDGLHAVPALHLGRWHFTGNAAG